jgi:hypothetical protein
LQNRLIFFTFPTNTLSIEPKNRRNWRRIKEGAADSRAPVIEVKAVVSQLLGAVLRAAIVMLILATPSLLLPGTSPEGAQVVMLVALMMGLFVAFEYAAAYPALVEFRDAPPFNRVRALTLLLMLFCLSVVARADAGSTLTLVFNAVGLLVGRALDFPFSPVRLLLDHVPQAAPHVWVLQLQIMAGLAVFITLFSLCVFAMLIRLHHWPHRDSAFNVWINLPTFDPTTGGDVVRRLVRDGRVNIILGFALPFLIPVVGVVAVNHMGVTVLNSPHAMVWGIGLWMFLPLSMFMRGLAMARIADMIAQRRARLVADLQADGPVPLAASGRVAR